MSTTELRWFPLPDQPGSYAHASTGVEVSVHRLPRSKKWVAKLNHVRISKAEWGEPAEAREEITRYIVDRVSS